MILILTENELKEAITGYLGNDYNIQGFNLVAGRGGNGNRVEVTATRKGSNIVETLPFEPDEPVEEELVKNNRPIFHNIEK